MAPSSRRRPIPDLETVNRNREYLRRRDVVAWRHLCAAAMNENHPDFTKAIDYARRHDLFYPNNSNYLESPYHQRPRQEASQMLPPPMIGASNSIQDQTRSQSLDSRLPSTMTSQASRISRGTTTSRPEPPASGAAITQQNRRRATTVRNAPNVAHTDAPGTDLADTARLIDTAVQAATAAALELINMDRQAKGRFTTPNARHDKLSINQTQTINPAPHLGVNSMQTQPTQIIDFPPRLENLAEQEPASSPGAYATGSDAEVGWLYEVSRLMDEDPGPSPGAYATSDAEVTALYEVPKRIEHDPDSTRTPYDPSLAEAIALGLYDNRLLRRQ